MLYLLIKSMYRHKYLSIQLTIRSYSRLSYPQCENMFGMSLYNTETQLIEFRNYAVLISNSVQDMVELNIAKGWQKSLIAFALKNSSHSINGLHCLSIWIKLIQVQRLRTENLPCISIDYGVFAYREFKYSVVILCTKNVVNEYTTVHLSDK